MYVKPCVKEIVRIGGRQGRAGFLRLDMNENPGGLPLEFVEKVKRELTPEFLAMYPEEERVKELLAQYLGGDLTPEYLCLTNGSDMGIRYLYEVFAEPGSAVVTVAPSFEMYRIYSEVFGLVHRPVVLEEANGFEIPLAQILDAIQEDTDVVVLLNPNNPVGRAYTEAEFIQITDRARQVGALVIVDEAYHYFYRQTFLSQAITMEHVAVLRTFSKLMSLAGCRMGYMAANPRIIRYLSHVRPSFEVNAVALKFAERLLEQPQLIQWLQAQAQEGKDYLVAELTGHGYEVRAQEGNFIFTKPRNMSAHQAAQALEEQHRVLVKTYRTPALLDWMRVSTGARPYMESFFTSFLAVDGAAKTSGGKR